MNNDHHQHHLQQQHHQQLQQRHHLLTSSFPGSIGLNGGGMAADAAAAAAMSSAMIMDDNMNDDDSSNGGGPDDDEEAEGVWAPDIEQAFQEAIQLYLPCGRRKIILQDEGKMYGRNELIARYIKLRVGKTRTRKQVSSHIQVLARKKTRELHTRIKDPSQRDKALHQLATMSSAQIVSAPFFAVAAAAAAQQNSLPPGMMPTQHNHHHPHNAFAAMQQQQHPHQHAAHLWPTNQAAAAAAAAQHHHHHQQQHAQQQQQQQQHNNAQNQHHHQAAAAAAAVAAAAAAHQLSSSCNNNSGQNSAFGHGVINHAVPSASTAAGGSGAAAGAWENRYIASQRLRMTQFWAYLEYVAVKKSAAERQPSSSNVLATAGETTAVSSPSIGGDTSNISSRHTFLHIGSGNINSNSNKCDNNTNNNGEPSLETIDIKEIHDKFPEKKSGLKDLYEKGPSQAFFLVKCWVDLNFGNMLATASANNDATFFGHNTEFESSEQMEITCSTQLCSSGKLVVEKVENECARLENDRFVYRFNRSPMCEYMINFITKLKQLADQSAMNSVLENFTILQVVTNRTTSETLLCIAYVFEVLGADEHEPQHNVYRLVDDEKTALPYSAGGAANNVNGLYGH